MKRALIMNPIDSVCVVIQDVTAGDEIDVGDMVITSVSDIPMPHKMALKDISVNEIIYKYGAPIGYALMPIKKGEWVHVNNLGPDKLESWGGENLDI